MSDELKIQLGCGSNHLPGWENHDADIDITKPLPWPDNWVDFIFIEHCVEHVTHKQSYDFFVECMRVLKPGGVVRIAVPSVVQIHEKENDGYRNFIKRMGWGDGSKGCGVKAIIFQHGHEAIWSRETLAAVLQSIGFTTCQLDVGESIRPQLQNVESHWKVIGIEFNNIDTIVVEAQKPNG